MVGSFKAWCNGEIIAWVADKYIGEMWYGNRRETSEGVGPNVPPTGFPLNKDSLRDEKGSEVEKLSFKTSVSHLQKLAKTRRNLEAFVSHK